MRLRLRLAGAVVFVRGPRLGALLEITCGERIVAVLQRLMTIFSELQFFGVAEAIVQGDDPSLLTYNILQVEI